MASLAEALPSAHRRPPMRGTEREHFDLEVLEQLGDRTLRLGTDPADDPVVFGDGYGPESRLNVSEIAGGITAWETARLPLATGP